MGNSYNSIDAALGTVFVKQDNEIIPVETPKEIVPVAPVVRKTCGGIAPSKETIHSNFAEDYDFIRMTLKDMITDGKKSLESATTLAEETESPRAFEVCTSIITTISGLGKELVNLHKEAMKLTTASDSGGNIVAENVTQVQNNYYAPTPKELQSVLDTVVEVVYDDSDLE